MPERITLEGDRISIKKPICFDCAAFLWKPPMMDSCYVRRGAQGKSGWFVVGYRCRVCGQFINWEKWMPYYEKGFWMYSYYYNRAFKFMEKQQYKLLLNDIRKKYGLRTL